MREKIGLQRLWMALVFVLAACCVAPVVQAQSPLITLTQGDFSVDIKPLSGTQSASEFYDYRSERSNLEFIEAGRSALFFYQDTTTGTLSLMVIHGRPALDVTNSTGIVRFIFSDLPMTTTVDVRDDPQDKYDVALPAIRFRWKWYTGRTDGAVLNNLGDDFNIGLFPHFMQGVKEWDIITESFDGSPRVVTLPHLDQAIQMSTGPAAGRGTRADFRFFPREPYTFLPITFDAQASLAPLGEGINLYEWDFDGDGVFDAHVERPILTHVYQQSGAKEVTLRVTSTGGETATFSQTVNLSSVERLNTMREISTPTALPESTIRVTVTFQAEQDLVGLGVEESWPPGWRIRPVQNDGAILKAGRGQWVFPDIIRDGETKVLVYDVTLPPAVDLDDLPDDFHVNGSVTSSLPPFKTEIQGEDTVRVASCLSIPEALAHYDVEFDEIDLRLNELITVDQFNHVERLWLEGGTLPGACSLSVVLSEFQKVVSYRSLSRTIDTALPSGGLGRGIRVDRTVLTSLPNYTLYMGADNGNRFRVQLDVDVLRRVNSLGIAETLPSSWQMTPLEVPNSMYNERTGEWLLFGPFAAGSQLRLFYDVVIPPNSTPDIHLIRGTALLADSNFSEIITGQNVIQVAECLSTLVAIAHWNVDTHEIDLSLDNAIQPVQAIAATDLWLNEREVPGTCGETINFEMLQLITNYALAGVPVYEELP